MRETNTSAKTHADDPDLRITDPSSGMAIDPGTQPGYYAGYSTMGQRKFWEKATRDVVEGRLTARPLRRFFTEEE